MNVFAAAEAIDDAVANGAKVVRACRGGSSNVNTSRTAIENTDATVVLIVTAAMNRGNNKDGWRRAYPAFCTTLNLNSLEATHYTANGPSSPAEKRLLWASARPAWPSCQPKSDYLGSSMSVKYQEKRRRRGYQ